MEEQLLIAAQNQVHHQAYYQVYRQAHHQVHHRDHHQVYHQVHHQVVQLLPVNNHQVHRRPRHQIYHQVHRRYRHQIYPHHRLQMLQRRHHLLTLNVKTYQKIGMIVMAIHITALGIKKEGAANDLETTLKIWGKLPMTPVVLVAVDLTLVKILRIGMTMVDRNTIVIGTETTTIVKIMVTGSATSGTQRMRLAVFVNRSYDALYSSCYLQLFWGGTNRFQIDFMLRYY